MKVCTICKQEKPREQFAISKRSRDGLHTFCKACKAAKSMEWYRATPERQRDRNKRRYEKHGAAMRATAAKWYRENRGRLDDLRQNWRLRKHFGMSLADYDALLKSQNGLCALCGRPSTTPNRRRPLAVDHCHSTNAVRGLLCRACNVGLGHFQDSPTLLRAAAEYVERAGAMSSRR